MLPAFELEMVLHFFDNFGLMEEQQLRRCGARYLMRRTGKRASGVGRCNVYKIDLRLVLSGEAAGSSSPKGDSATLSSKLMAVQHRNIPAGLAPPPL
jgi:hypothetical protein